MSSADEEERILLFIYNKLKRNKLKIQTVISQNVKA
jgi:hypothetical protein